MKRFVLTGAVAFGFSIAGAFAQGPALNFQPDDIIATRQALMDLQQADANAMKALVESGGENVKPMAFAAKALMASTKVIPSLFPAGTERGHDTRAKPEIWSDRAGFEKAAANATAAAEKLMQVANANDKAGFAAQFQVLGQACGACHRPYRSQ